jgi:hypothetical protein
VAFHRILFLSSSPVLVEATSPTSVRNGFNNTLHRCKPRTNRHRHKCRHSYLLSFDERDYWVNNRRRCTLANLRYHRQFSRLQRCYQASRCRYRLNSMLAKEHLQVRVMVGLPRQLLDLSISRSCRSSQPTRCTFSSRHQHNRESSNCNRHTPHRNSLRHPSTSTTGYPPHHNRRRTQAEIRQQRPQVNTNLRPLPHTNLVNVRRLMRLTVSTSAPPKSGRPKALTQRHRPQHRHHNPTHHHPSRMYRRHRHQRPDDEDTHELVQMHLHEVQRVL